MKKTRTALLGLAIATAGLFSFYSLQTASIKGRVTPADSGVRAWAISGTDTLRTNVSQGSFEFPRAKAGTYRLIIEAKAPYQNIAKDSVEVVDGQTTDVGEITLRQQ